MKTKKEIDFEYFKIFYIMESLMALTVLIVALICFLQEKYILGIVMASISSIESILVFVETRKCQKKLNLIEIY